MEALKAEALKIQAEIEEFSSRTAKEVAVLLAEISSTEDESENMKKKTRCIDAQITNLVKEKEALKLSLLENDRKLSELLVKKRAKDKMVDEEMDKYMKRDREVKEILIRLSKPDPPMQTNVPIDAEMVDYLKQTIAKKEEDLLCPVCLETSQIPIFTCPDSHILCSSCVTKVSMCPQCREVLPKPLKRHRFAEKTAKELEEFKQKLGKLSVVDQDLGQDTQPCPDNCRVKPTNLPQPTTKKEADSEEDSEEDPDEDSDEDSVPECLYVPPTKCLFKPGTLPECNEIFRKYGPCHVLLSNDNHFSSFLRQKIVSKVL